MPGGPAAASCLLPASCPLQVAVCAMFVQVPLRDSFKILMEVTAQNLRPTWEGRHKGLLDPRRAKARLNLLRQLRPVPILNSFASYGATAINVPHTLLLLVALPTHALLFSGSVRRAPLRLWLAFDAKLAREKISQAFHSRTFLGSPQSSLFDSHRTGEIVPFPLPHVLCPHHQRHQNMKPLRDAQDMIVQRHSFKFIDILLILIQSQGETMAGCLQIEDLLIMLLHIARLTAFNTYGEAIRVQSSPFHVYIKILRHRDYARRPHAPSPCSHTQKICPLDSSSFLWKTLPVPFEAEKSSSAIGAPARTSCGFFSKRHHSSSTVPIRFISAYGTRPSRSKGQEILLESRSSALTQDTGDLCPNIHSFYLLFDHAFTTGYFGLMGPRNRPETPRVHHPSLNSRIMPEGTDCSVNGGNFGAVRLSRLVILAGGFDTATCLVRLGADAHEPQGRISRRLLRRSAGDAL
ncbi:hypothetical protein C8J57DRAFT_1233021 [Mycena rebaudengoi]|nr:hypothetical protein C8J57DRAFT_1233021 [Mycena rebaudengoi]